METVHFYFMDTNFKLKNMKISDMLNRSSGLWQSMVSNLVVILMLSFFCIPVNGQRPNQVIPFLVTTEVIGEGLELTLNGKVSTFRGEQLYTADKWSWDFGDGHGSESKTARHIYAEPGHYKLCLDASGPEGRTRYCHLLEVFSDDSPKTRPGMQVSYLPMKGKLFTWFDTQLGMGAIHIEDSEGEVLWEGPLSIESMEMDVSRVKPGKYTFKVRQPWIEEDRFELELD